MQATKFQKLVLEWFDRFGRKDLPWQLNPTPYRVWISEIMLQQTQVSTVIPYFNRFIARFPTVESLSTTSLDSVLSHWSGLGYYARARNLHKAAQQIAEAGAFPDSLEDLLKLPGIGPSTAGAVMSIGFQQRAPILDGNVKRVLSRLHAIEGWPGNPKVSRELWQLSERYTPDDRIADYTQAIMDIGATVCTRANPHCDRCPIRTGCQSLADGKVGELPMPRPRKKIPVRKRFFLVICNQDGGIYLENRPPTGIWGGLWSVPEFHSHEDMVEWCMENRIDHTSLSYLEERRHTFSHYHMDYKTAIAHHNRRDDDRLEHVLEVDRKVWYNPRKDDRLGLPKPVSRLIEQINQLNFKDDQTR